MSTPLTFPDYVTPHARDLLKRILVPDPRKRADLFEVARHSWLSEFASVVGFITSNTTTPKDIANTTVVAGESSSSVRHFIKTNNEFQILSLHPTSDVVHPSASHQRQAMSLSLSLAALSTKLIRSTSNPNDQLLPSMRNETRSRSNMLHLRVPRIAPTAPADLALAMVPLHPSAFLKLRKTLIRLLSSRTRRHMHLP